MQVTSFTTQELAVCLDALYGPKDGAFFNHTFKCKESMHPQLRDAITIEAPKEYMTALIAKVKELNFRCWTKDEPINDIDCFYSSRRLTLAHAGAVTIFKKALGKDLQADQKAYDSYTIKTEYKRAML